MATLLRIKRSIENDVWKIVFSLDLAALSESDKELMRKFGEPTINAGGTFVDPTVPSAFNFTLPDKIILVRTEMPYTQTFDSKSPDFLVATQAKALVYENTFITRYQQAFTTLRSLTDTFSGERVVTLN
jgi:hypothetical protein